MDAQWAHIVHCGEWRLKGVNSDLAAIQMLPAQLAGRMFPSHLSSSKAKQVRLASSMLRACSSHSRVSSSLPYAQNT